MASFAKFREMQKMFLRKKFAKNKCNDAYVSQNPDEAIVQMGDSTKAIIQKPKKPKPKRPKKFTGLANCVFSQADEDFEDFSHSYF